MAIQLFRDERAEIRDEGIVLDSAAAKVAAFLKMLHRYAGKLQVDRKGQLDAKPFILRTRLVPTKFIRR